MHADTVDSTDVFEVLFYGKVGDNECFAFSEFKPVFGLNEITVTVMGKETIKNDCSAASPRKWGWCSLFNYWRDFRINVMFLNT